MYTNFEKMLAAISRCLPAEGEPTQSSCTGCMT